MNNKKKAFPHAMTFKELIIYIITVVLMGIFFFFVRDDLAGKLVAFLVCPMIIIYIIYAYRKEKKADSNALQKNSDIMSGDYFESPKWREEYTAYSNNHPFERPKILDMKKDLLRRFRRREDLMWSILFFL